MSRFGAALYGAAERYIDMGISIVPVGGKEALMRWGTAPDPADVLDVIAGDPRCTGIAAILGPNANLVCRDWDDADSFASWQSDHPLVARSLPMVRSARGGHAYTVAHGVRTKTLADGELRGSGAYILLPPSLTVDPPSGAPKKYEWMNTLPRSLDLIQRVDPAILIGQKISQGHAARLAERPEPEPPGPLIRHEYGGLGEITISECIRRSLPSGPGQRNGCLFELARQLRAALPSDTSEDTLNGIVAEWFELARPTIGTKSLRVSQRTSCAAGVESSSLSVTLGT